MHRAEAVRNENIVVGAFAYKAEGKRSGSDLVLVLCWCSPTVLLWVYSDLGEEGISPIADTRRAGDHLSCFIYSYSVAEAHLRVVHLDIELWSC